MVLTPIMGSALYDVLVEYIFYIENKIEYFSTKIFIMNSIQCYDPDMYRCFDDFHTYWSKSLDGLSIILNAYHNMTLLLSPEDELVYILEIIVFSSGECTITTQNAQNPDTRTDMRIPSRYKRTKTSFLIDPRKFRLATQVDISRVRSGIKPNRTIVFTISKEIVQE